MFMFRLTFVHISCSPLVASSPAAPVIKPAANVAVATLVHVRALTVLLARLGTHIAGANNSSGRQQMTSELSVVQLHPLNLIR
jgi:hypothetical protein